MTPRVCLTAQTSSKMTKQAMNKTAKLTVDAQQIVILRPDNANDPPATSLRSVVATLKTDAARPRPPANATQLMPASNVASLAAHHRNRSAAQAAPSSGPYAQRADGAPAVHRLPPVVAPAPKPAGAPISSTSISAPPPASSVQPMRQDTGLEKAPNAKRLTKGEAAMHAFSNVDPRKAVVTAYRFAGFAALTVILLGLGIYLSTHLFFLSNHGWAVPTVITPNDPRVLQLASQVTQSAGRRDGLMGQRLDLDVKRRSAERALATEVAFQEAFRAALATDLDDRKGELERFRDLIRKHSAARQSVAAASEAFRVSSRSRLKDEYAAGLIDKDRRVGGELQLAQIAESNASLGTKEIELESRASTISREVSALEATLRSGQSNEVSIEVLKTKQEYEHSLLASQRAADEAAAAAKSIAMLDTTIAAEQQIFDAAKGSPFMEAVSQPAALAFFPYDNTGAAKAGAPVYECFAGFVLCRQVGHVERVIDGEFTDKHPLLHHELRGVYAVLKLDAPSAGHDTVLHVGRKPLFI